MATLYTIKGKEHLPALPRKAAIMAYQDYLLAGYQFKTVKTTAPVRPAHEAVGHCKPCFEHLHSGCLKDNCQCACRAFNG